MAGNRLALIVATDEYVDPGLRKLRAPGADAEALASVLADPELGDFEVEVLRNGTSSAIAERVETLLAGGKASDLIVLHFSCHGLKDDSGELYLAATNTRPTLLASTAVDASLVNRLMRRSRAQRAVLFLDCCFGGAFERGVVPRAAGVIDVADQFQQRGDELGGGRGRVVITASNAMEFAFEGSDLSDAVASQPSIFTGALVQGLATGAADRDQDGMVSLGELYDYVFDRVREESPNQTPGKWEFGVQGELVLAKNPQRVMVPAPLPPDLLELVDHPFPPTRLGSIEILSRLAEGTNLPVAAGARNVLERLANDDSRAVATAATEAVVRTSLRVSVGAVDLGTLTAGDEAEGEVLIEGVPLATASRVEASIPALRVRRLDRTIRIEADTSVPGRIDGVVTVSGPAGNAEINVVGEVIDPRLRGRKRERVEPPAPIVEARAEPPVESPSEPAPATASPTASVAVTAPRDSSASPVRRLIDRGWQTGHIQTLVGAEIGALAIVGLDLTDTLKGSALAGTDFDLVQNVEYAVTWAAAVVGALLFLHFAGPAGYRRTVIALALLFPIYRVLGIVSTDPNVENFARTAIVVAVFALIASTVVRLKRTQVA